MSSASSIDMLNDPSQAAFYSNLEIDKIIGTFEGSFELDSPTAGNTNTVTDTITTEIPETTFFVGVFSIDGGASWNTFGADINHVEALSPATNPQGDCLVYGVSKAGSFDVVGANTANFTATQFFDLVVEYKIALIAKPDQGDITPQPISADVIFDTRLNYLKIAFDEIFETSGVPRETVDHDLGYPPRTKIFVEQGGELYSYGYWGVSDLATITSTQVSAVGSFLAGKLYIRIYYDG